MRKQLVRHVRGRGLDYQLASLLPASMAEGAAPGQSCEFCTKLIHNTVEFYNLLYSTPATPSLEALTNELESVSDWHSLGVNLDLKNQQLKEIEKNHCSDDKVCKTKVLSCWLDNTLIPTWEDVVEALNLMDEHTVANKIQRKYIFSIEV